MNCSVMHLQTNPLGLPAESNLVPRCINGELARPTPPSDDSPSTACQASTVCAPGGVPIGKAPPGFGSCQVLLYLEG